MFAPQAGRDGAGTVPTDQNGSPCGEITAWDRSRTVASRLSSCGVGTDPVGTGTDPSGRNGSRGGEITAWNRPRTVVSQRPSYDMGTGPLVICWETVSAGEITVRNQFGCRNLLGANPRQRDYGSDTGRSIPEGRFSSIAILWNRLGGLCVDGVEFGPVLVQRPSGSPDFPFGTNRSDGGLGVDRPADFE